MQRQADARYNFAPIITTTIFASFICTLSNSANATIPSSMFSADARAAAAKAAPLSSPLIRTWMSESRLTPAASPATSPLELQGSVFKKSVGSWRIHPAAFRFLSMTQANTKASEPTATESIYGWGANDLIASINAACWSSERTRGASFFSSEMIVFCCASIVDCCLPLIPSSKPNNRSVHAASTATPPTTSTLASENLGFSRTIPAATAKLATIAVVSSALWGQKGSNEPEKNSPAILYILAVCSWFGVALIAVIKWLWMAHKVSRKGH